MPTDRGKLVTIGGGIAVVAAVAVAVWLPYSQRAEGLRRSIDAERRLIADLRAEASAETQAQAPVLRTTATPDRAVPDRDQLGPLLERLGEELAAESLVVDQLEAHTVVEGSEFNRIPVTLRCNGGYGALFGLLRRLESGPRIIRIDRLEVIGDAAGGHPLLMDIEMSAFSMGTGAEDER